MGKALSALVNKSALRLLLATAVIGFSLVFVVTPALAAPMPVPAPGGAGTQPGVTGVPVAPTNGPATPTNPNADATMGQNTAGTNMTSAGSAQTNQNDGGDGASYDTLEGATSISGQMARSALSAALNRLGLWTTPNLQQKAGDKPNWFITQYRMMRVLGLYILMPMVLIAIIHAVMKASLALLLKSVFMFLPIAIIGTAVAIDLVQLLLNVTDDFSQVFINAILMDSNVYFTNVAKYIADPNIPFLLDFMLSICLGIVCVFVYVVMIVRESSVYLATAFLPIGFALMVWPATAKWFKRMIEFLVGVILSKLVMVAAISLAVAALTASTALGASKQTAGTQTLAANGGNISTVGVSSGAGSNPLAVEVSNIISAVALFVIVCWAPSMTISLVGKLGVGEMAQHVGSAITKPSALAQLMFYDRLMSNSNNAKRLQKARADGADLRIEAKNAPPLIEQRLESLGIYRNRHGNYEIDDAMLDTARFTDLTDRTLLKNMTSEYSGANANSIAQAYMALKRGGDQFDGFDVPTDMKGGAARTLGAVVRSKDGSSDLVLNISNRMGMPQKTQQRVLESVMEAEAVRQIADRGGVSGVRLQTAVRRRIKTNVDDQPVSVDGRTKMDRKLADAADGAVRSVSAKFRNTDGSPMRIRAVYAQPASVAQRLAYTGDPASSRQTAGRNGV